ncbi:alpha/beta-hydrolase [Sodiomyces alkalinus F11]|uniref:Carboxylic ester hydrolase n=1 Tax=Sodiomyces alkalinus (strain CBS 110278 / VKM F-3762 / F11) TaxID=1314773 RepID=A0A3N2PKZ6_SODAK|nr:alpha/beta-hydrolase [Sodiomyces alkalinus F11]ROT35090.1 alpha/beta-hydrolase [Sodiomyces alkalinus F11]
MKLGLFPLAAGLLAQLSSVQAVPATPPNLEARFTKVTVTSPAGSVIGRSLAGIETFAGIPFAEPPVGPLRLRPPIRLNSTLDRFDATGIAAACPQMFLSTDAKNTLLDVLGDLLTLPLFQVVNGREDCLTVTVQRPAGVPADAKLPVLVWIFGGGFQLGSSSMYDATGLLSNAKNTGQPFVFVAINYRVGGFGFLPGAEVLADGAANLGLRDQRMALEWVADNVASFGGDPGKVTIWGESAGAISVLDMMVAYDGDNTYKGRPLFRGAIMNSGSIVPTQDVDAPKAQAVYDLVASKAGCAGAPDSLACLRNLDYETFLRAANSVPGIVSYHSVALSYLPRPDGDILTKSPDLLVAEGRYAAVPMISGNQEDEGTLFALFQRNVATSSQLVGYLSDLFFHGASRKDLTDLVATYSWRPSRGSPFRTGVLNVLYPGFKRNAAVLGDLVFTLTRRVFLKAAKTANPSVKAWSYLASYNQGLPFLGTFHGSDLLQVFYGVLPNYASRAIQTYYFNFVHNLDPNVGVRGFPAWPEWRPERPRLAWFFNDRSDVLDDNFRQKSCDFIESNVRSLHFRDEEGNTQPRWGL